MKYCTKCGRELTDDAVFCPACGCACNAGMNSSMAAGHNEEDKVSVGFCVLAFFIPLFGFIYWAVKRQETPKNANAIGLTALISWGINFITSTIMSYVYADLFASIMGNFLG